MYLISFREKGEKFGNFKLLIQVTRFADFKLQDNLKLQPRIPLQWHSSQFPQIISSDYKQTLR